MTDVPGPPGPSSFYDPADHDERERRLRAPHVDDDLPARITIRQLVRIYQILRAAESGQSMHGALRDVQLFILAVAHASGTVPFAIDITVDEAWADVDRWHLVDPPATTPRPAARSDLRHSA